MKGVLILICLVFCTSSSTAQINVEFQLNAERGAVLMKVINSSDSDYFIRGFGPGLVDDLSMNVKIYKKCGFFYINRTKKLMYEGHLYPTNSSYEHLDDTLFVKSIWPDTTTLNVLDSICSFIVDSLKQKKFR